MTTVTVEREELHQLIQRLPDDKVITAVEFLRKLRSDSDPFYSESNIKHLLAVKSDAQAGINMLAHDLIEADDA